MRILALASSREVVQLDESVRGIEDESRSPTGRPSARGRSVEAAVRSLEDASRLIAVGTVKRIELLVRESADAVRNEAEDRALRKRAVVQRRAVEVSVGSGEKPVARIAARKDEVMNDLEVLAEAGCARQEQKDGQGPDSHVVAWRVYCRLKVFTRKTAI